MANLPLPAERARSCPWSPAAGLWLAQGRARGALAWALALFVCAQLALLVFTDCWRPELGHAEYGYRLRLLHKRLAKEPDRPLLLVLGSSRTEVGFRPALLPAYRAADGSEPLVFNFAFASTGPVEQMLYVHRLLDQGIRPRWVMLEVLPSSLSTWQAPLEKYVHLERVAWKDLPVMSRHCDRPVELYRHWGEERLPAWFAQRFSFLSHCAPLWVPNKFREKYIQHVQDRNGWLPWPQPTVTEEERRRGQEHARKFYGAAIEHLRIGALMDECLRDVLDICRQEGIPVALFLMPEGNLFRSWYPPQAWAAVDAYLARLQREYGVPVVNAREWMTEADFCDGHHLLPDRTAAFTERFGTEAIEPFLAGKLSPSRAGGAGSVSSDCSSTPAAGSQPRRGDRE